MRNHTTDPAKRAASIADQEEKKVWEETKDSRQCSKTRNSVYKQSLIEFVSQVDINK